MTGPRRRASLTTGAGAARTHQPGGCHGVRSTQHRRVVLIEYQNDFTSEGGALHDAVSGVMDDTGMLDKSRAVAEQARRVGATRHAPITFAEGYGELGDPDAVYGILKGVVDTTRSSRAAGAPRSCDDVAPQAGDIVVEGKRGLDAFATTNLDFILRSRGIQTVALGGFLTNCCVESTMRTGLREGLRGGHPDRLHRGHQRRGAAGGSRPRLPDVLAADDRLGVHGVARGSTAAAG